MRLYVWQGDRVLQDYTSGQVVALARDLDEAVVVIKAADDICLGKFPIEAPTDVIHLGECPGIKPKAWVVWGGG